MRKASSRSHDPTADETYFALDGAQGLATAAQFGAIEFHGRMCRAETIDAPDRMVFDLDPDESLGSSRVRDAALLIRQALEAAGSEILAAAFRRQGRACRGAARRSATASSEVQAFAEAFAKTLSRASARRLRRPP